MGRPDGAPASNRRDLTGRRFGRLVAVEFVRRNKHRRAIWLCHCDCGRATEALIGNLLFGKIKSCGCARGSRKGQPHIRHGAAGSPEHRSWIAMQQRCYNSNCRYYHRYGARGILVAQEWLGVGGFERFIAHVGPRPSSRHSIDRINNDGNYEPGNVRWATKRQQSQNTSRAHIIEHNGKALCVSEWARRLGVRCTTLFGRLKRYSGPEVIAYFEAKCQ